MGIDRRGLFAALAGATALGAASEARAAQPRETASRAELDAASLGVRPNAPEDQSQNLQRAIEQAATARAVLRLPPGFYRAGALQLPSYAAISGVGGATRIVMAGGPSMMSATGSDHVSVTGIVLDGAGIPLPERRGLLHVAQAAPSALPIAKSSIPDAMAFRSKRSKAKSAPTRSTAAMPPFSRSMHAGSGSPGTTFRAPAMAEFLFGAARPATTAR
jgi:uncharacterized secreted repeat protein (TIGR03808 family)